LNFRVEQSFELAGGSDAGFLHSLDGVEVIGELVLRFVHNPELTLPQF
jgi:hypothetical protein